MNRYLVDKKYPFATNYFKTNKKIVILTIDDGPDNYSTTDLLELLHVNAASATFFVTGCEAERYRGELELIAASQSEVANHSYYEWRQDNTEIEDIQKAHDLLKAYRDNKWFRAPGGDFNPATLAKSDELGYTNVMADVYTFDHLGGHYQLHYHLMKSLVKPGSIMVMHQGKNNRGLTTLKVLERLLPYLYERGYTVLSLSRALGILNKRC